MPRLLPNPAEAVRRRLAREVHSTPDYALIAALGRHGRRSEDDLEATGDEEDTKQRDETQDVEDDFHQVTSLIHPSNRLDEPKFPGSSVTPCSQMTL